MKDSFEANESGILFIMSVRNRKSQAIASIKSVVDSGLGKSFDFLIVQDFDKDNLSLADFNTKTFNNETVGKIKIINAKIGGVFYKTKLLNRGIRMSGHKFIVQQDADIVFSRLFLLTLLKICSDENNFKKYFFCAPYFESDDMSAPAINKQAEIRKKGAHLSDTYIFYRPQIEAVHGYDERIRMWNEEKDIEYRIATMFGLQRYDLGVVGIRNTHITHGNELRSGSIFVNDDNVVIVQNNILNRTLTANPDGWGEIK